MGKESLILDVPLVVGAGSGILFCVIAIIYILTGYDILEGFTTLAWGLLLLSLGCLAFVLFFSIVVVAVTTKKEDDLE